jgi:xylulokinase
VTSAPLLCGVDAGTSRVRAIIVEPGRGVVATHGAPTPTVVVGPGQGEHDAEALWRVTVEAIRGALAAVESPSRVRGLAVASVGEAGTLLDAAGRPTHPVIAWYDTRTTQDLRGLLAAIGRDRLVRLTGLCPDPTFSLLKLLWLRRHRPEAWARGRRWLHISDWLAFRLTGVPATDHTLASRTMMLDLERGAWAADLMGELGLPRDLLAEIRPLGHRLGRISAEAAGETGLPADCAVGVGGHDHFCGALAIGADRPGVVMDSMGTAEALTLMLGRPSTAAGLADAGLNQGMLRVEEPVYYVFGGLPTSAASVEWFRRLVGGAGHEMLLAEARAIPPGAGGPLFLPHLRIGSPPFPDPIARGAFFGLADTTDRAALYRAVLEGLAADAANVLEQMLGLLGRGALERYIVIGGSTRNDLLMGIKASLLERVLEVSHEPEAVGIGAAMLGGLAAGVFDDLGDARARLPFRPRRVEPCRSWPVEDRRHRRRVHAEAYAMARRLHRLLLDGPASGGPAGGAAT